MTIRKKTLLIVGTILFGLICVISLMSFFIIGGGFNEIEANETARDVERALNAINREITALDGTMRDFSSWDETYAYARHKNKKFAGRYLSAPVMERFRINFAMIVDTSGHIRFSRSYNLRRGEVFSLSYASQEELAARLIKQSGAGHSVRGIFLLDNEPTIVVLRPILTGEEKGPIAGHLIFCRKLDDFTLRGVAELTQLSLVMYRADDPALPPDMKAGRRVLSKTHATHIALLNDSIIAGYASINDIFGTPLLLLRVDQPRIIFQQQQASQRYLIISVLVSALIFSLAVFFILEKFVLGKIARLNRDVREIAMHGDFQRRLVTRGRDELTSLAGEINRMLGKIEMSERLISQTSEARYRAVVEDQTEWICRYAPDGQLTFINEAFCRHFSIKRETLLGQSVLEYIPEEEHKNFRDSLAALHREQDVGKREYHVVRADQITWQQWMDRPIKDPSGHILEFQSVGRDITDLKNAEAALRQRVDLENLLTTVSSSFINIPLDEIDQAIDDTLRRIGEFAGVDSSFVYLCSDNGVSARNTNRWCAPMVASWTDHRLELMLEETIPWFALKMKQHEPVYFQNLDQLPEEAAKDKRFLSEQKIKSLAAFPMISKGAWIGCLGFVTCKAEKTWPGEIIPSLTIISSIIVNILERRQTDAALRKTEANLRQAQKMEAIGTLAGGIAHDFNNILAAIIGYTEIAAMQARSNKELQRKLRQIWTASDRAKKLIQQILSFSRPGEQEKKPVTINPIIKEALKLLRSAIPSTIHIVSNIDANACTVLSDPTQIHQVVMNLCTNAAHAMRGKGGTLSVELMQVVTDGIVKNDLPPGRYARLTISDTGHGIDPAIIDKIFDPFFTTKPQGEGTGLGLSVVYGIVQHHQGIIHVRSEKNRGSSFDIYLPLTETPADAEKSEWTSIPQGHERLLLVDDEETLIDVWGTLLESLGYQVTTQTDSQEALNIFRRKASQFDLVITDMTMPKMTGMALAEAILKIRPVPILLCTGYSEPMMEEKIRSVGIRKLLPKPFSIKDLGVAVRSILDKDAVSGTGFEFIPDAPHRIDQVAV